MNDQLSILILNKLGSVSYLSKMSGIAKVYTMVQEADGGRSVTKKIPVSTYTTAAQCGGKTSKQYDLVPNSGLRGLLYFEELAGIRLIEKKDVGNKYESKLRIVCWLNPKLIDSSTDATQVATKVMTDLMRRITADQHFHDPAQYFSTVTIDVENIPEKSAQLFSRYDYDEKMTQYLMYPYDYFAIDLSIKYLVPFKVCGTTYNPTPGTSCTSASGGEAIPIGGSGGGGIPVINADNGGALDPTPAGRHYVLTYHNVRNSSFSFYIDKQASINWGDGTPIQHYPGDHLIQKTYANVGDGPIEIKCYWEVEPLNTCKVIYCMPSGANTAILDSLTGDIPTNLWRLNLSNGLVEIPLSELPPTVNYFSLRRCSLTAQKQNELVSWCRANVEDLSTIFINTANQTTDEVPDSTTQDYLDIIMAGGRINND